MAEDPQPEKTVGAVAVAVELSDGEAAAKTMPEKASAVTATPHTVQEPVAQPAEQPKVDTPSKVGIPQRRFTGISINEVQGPMQFKNLESRVVEQLTQERLEELWNELIMRNQDDDKFCNLLADKKVELKNNNLFTIQVPNLYFDSLFRDCQKRILGFLRESTGNDMLQFKVVVAVEHVEHKAYLPREKFEELVKVNPALLSLRKLFPDIDF